MLKYTLSSFQELRLSILRWQNSVGAGLRSPECNSDLAAHPASRWRLCCCSDTVLHGAFSVPTGTVTVRWQLENDGPDKGHLRIGWMERGGPAVNGFQTNGFGYMMITKIVPLSLQGRASLELELEGVRWTLVVPANSVLAND